MKNAVLNGVKSAGGKVWDFTVGALAPVGRVSKSVVRSPVFWAFSMVAAVFAFFGAVDLFAQTTTNAVELEPIVEFGSLFDTIRDAIAPLIVGALGLGLAIWCARYIFSIIKSMGR